MCYDELFKILILGDSSSGKTSILDRLVNNQFSNNYIATIGIDFNVKTIKIDNNTKIKLQIWDSCGQERFRSLTRSYYRNSAAFIICYDISSAKSFQNAKFWIDEIEKYVDKDDVVKILVGNKNDLEDLRQIDYEEGKQYARTIGMDFFETSAKNNTNINKLFHHLSSILNDETIKKLEWNKNLLDIKNRRKNCC